jgi:hypothetical protein
VSVEVFAQVAFEARAGVTWRSTMARIDFEDRSETSLLRAAPLVACRAQGSRGHRRRQLAVETCGFELND